MGLTNGSCKFTKSDFPAENPRTQTRNYFYTRSLGHIKTNTMANILVTGGTGLIGRHLCKRLKEKGYSVSILSRTQNDDSGFPIHQWNIEQGLIDQEAITTADYIIHLAGANIADKRWTKNRKKTILDSRQKPAHLIYSKINESNKSIKAFISASAIGYYGAESSKKTFSEDDSPAKDFLGSTCEKWENSTELFKEKGIRTVLIRTGVVLTSNGGALAKMKTPVDLGIASALGDGKQFLPWIHIDDLCNIYIKAIEDIEMTGPYNAVAPDHKTNKEFTHVLARVLKKPFWFPNVPAFTMKLIFGELSKILLEGSRVSSNKIRTAGYKFLFLKLEDALNNLLIK